MKKYFVSVALAAALTACNHRRETLTPAPFQTVCNPVNMSYMFQPDKTPAFREGADPTVMMFKDEYYTFVSHSGGYFHSTDLMNWTLIVPNDVFPFDEYSPTTLVVDNEVYLTSSSFNKVVKTSDPKSGVWEVAVPDLKINRPSIAYDPCLFLDDDGRLYCYAGCSNVDPIFGVELNPKTFDPLTERIPLIYANPKQHGWEEKNEYSEPNPVHTPWLEGAWMTKYKGKYYLQYASPGTDSKSYNDGVYISDHPLGPYTLAEHNSFALKPEGFLCGNGHGNIFQDRYGNYWHIATASIGVRLEVERRLSIYPLFFDDDDEMYTWNGFGDYPMILPDHKINAPEDFFPDWMLLSYGKPVEVSSTLPPYTLQWEWRKVDVTNDAKNINDEEIRTWWSAVSGSKDEWAKMDLGERSDVYALQINFADESSQLQGRNDAIYYQYTAEASDDGKNWQTIIDRSTNTIDMPHDYVQLPQPVKARYIRINNLYCPSGNFSIFDLRVFGKSGKAVPPPVQNFTVKRDDDTRTVHLKWDASPDAVGYNIRYGTRKDKLYHNYMVYGKNELSIHSLHAEKNYFFTVDAFNEGGITKGTLIK